MTKRAVQLCTTVGIFKNTHYYLGSLIMMMTQLFQDALNVNAPWFIKSIDFDPDKKHLDIYIDFKRGATFRDTSEDADTEKAYKAYDTQEKTWRHLNFFEHECVLHARVPRIKPDDGGIRLIQTPWSGIAPGFTLLFEALIIQFCASMPVHNVSQITGVSDYKIWKLLDAYIDAAKSNEDFSAINAVGMDETSVAKGHDYITLFVDLNQKRTIHISDGKDNTTVVDFVKVLEGKDGNRNNILDVSCDMSPAFIKGISENLPIAQITFDKFHIIKIINEAVDKVRREEAKNNPLLKGTRYIFLKNDENLTEEQKATKEELSLPELNLKSMRAMRIREAFQLLYIIDNIEAFEEFLNDWYNWATHSQLTPIIQVAKTIKNHWAGVLKWKESQINNGILEGLNSVLQAAKRKARGYKKEHFKTIAYLLTGKLDFSEVNANC